MIPKPPACSDCVLCDAPGELGFSAVEGLGTLRVHVVGEGLGEKEEHDGLPFRPDAPAGSVLERAIRRAGFSRPQFTIHNIIRCRPPRNELEGASYEDEAIHHCRRHFENVVRDYPPGCILACGNVALRALTGMSGDAERQVGYLRGYVLDSEYGPVISTFHPSYLRRGSSKFRDPSTGGKTKGTTGPGMALLGTLIHDLQRAVRVAAGLDTGFILHPEFEPRWFEAPEHRYIERASLDDATSFERYVMEAGPDAFLTYDLEHPRDRVEDPGDEGKVDFGDEGRDIFSVQFWCQYSPHLGKGIYFPWEGEYIEIAKRLFALPNPKAGHWNRKNDDPRLRSWGIIPSGRVEDLWEAFHHLQPDIPARLQNVASYMYYSLHPKRGVYAPWPFPWKHWRGSDPERYGIVDVHTVAERLPILHQELKRAGLWSGYQQVYELQSRVFRGMTDRGIPVDGDVHAGLKADFAAEQADMTTDLRSRIPDAARTVHNPDGYEKPPAIVRAAVIENEEVERVEGSKGETYVESAIQELSASPLVPSVAKDIGDLCECPAPGQHQGSLGFETGSGNGAGAKRWIQLRPFNPDSPQQVLAYIRAKGHPVPTNRAGKVTTSDIELERLVRKTRDPVYQMIRDIRELRTMAGTFVEAWRPGPDGRAHPEFYTAPGTGQHSSKRPNALNVPKHGKLAGRFRKMIAAKSGHRLVSFDWKSFHVLTLGFEARDADYMRMARLDMHTFVTSHFIKEPVDPNLPDDELRDRLKKIRAKHGKLRDAKVKHSVLGYQFGMGAKTLFERHREALSGIDEARQLLSLIDVLFPKAAAWRKQIVQVAHRQAYLMSRWGFIRYFWEVFRPDYRGSATGGASGDDHEAAIAYLPANDAFGLRNAVMVRLEDSGANDRFQLINEIHDELVFEPPVHLVEECLHTVRAEMERPDPVLSDPLVAPGGLWCGVEAKVGRNWGEMEDAR